MGYHRQFLYTIATSIMGDLGIVSSAERVESLAESEQKNFPHLLWLVHATSIQKIISKLDPGERGRIAACGVQRDASSGLHCHWEVNAGKGLDAPQSGDDLLTLLASYVIVATIADIIRADSRRMRGDADTIGNTICLSEATQECMT